MTTAKLTQWQQNIADLAIIYGALEQGKKLLLILEGDDVFLGPLLDDMHRKGYVEPKSSKGEWIITQQGDALRGRMVAMYDQLLKFDIFGKVNQALALTEAQSPDGIAVYDNLLDPRFTPCDQSVDLRLAMLTWYSLAAQDELGGKQVDLHQVVFMQKLRAGRYNDAKTGKLNADFWFDLRLGKVFQEIDQIVTTAVKWQDMADDEQGASSAMNSIYSSGMAEQIKRDGERCSCGAFIGMYAYYASKEGKTLDSCASCGGSYLPPPAPAAGAGEECPNCKHDILSWHRKCRGCGAKINRRLAPGTIQDVTTTYETETTYYNPWGSSYASYGYYPPAPLYYGVYYDPYLPLVSVAAFGLVCAIVL